VQWKRAVTQNIDSMDQIVPVSVAPELPAGFLHQEH
jgi:hypothetical protein